KSSRKVASSSEQRESFPSNSHQHGVNSGVIGDAEAHFMIRCFRGVHPQIHETAFIAETAQIIGDVHVGEQASVWYGTVVRGDMFYIRIGDRANIQDNCVLHTRTGEKPTILEEEVTAGP